MVRRLVVGAAVIVLLWLSATVGAGLFGLSLIHISEPTRPY